MDSSGISRATHRADAAGGPVARPCSCRLGRFCRRARDRRRSRPSTSSSRASASSHRARSASARRTASSAAPSGRTPTACCSSTSAGSRRSASSSCANATTSTPLSARCAHLGCTVNWFGDQRIFKCPCHGSEYHSNGTNFAGPAPRPLDRFRIELSVDGQLDRRHRHHLLRRIASASTVRSCGVATAIRPS